RDYWVETRQLVGDPQLKNGILVNWSPWNESNGGTQLINCNPQTHGQSPLQIGQVFYDTDIGLKISPLQRVDGPETAIDVQVDQIYFLPLELSLAQPAQSAFGSGDQNKMKIRTAPRREPAPISASTQVTIPADGTYRVWLQAIDSEGQASFSPVTLTDEQGQTGLAAKSTSTDQSFWRAVVGEASSTDPQGAPKVFSLAKGVHVLQVQATGGHIQRVRLLITNDP